MMSELRNRTLSQLIILGGGIIIVILLLGLLTIIYTQRGLSVEDTNLALSGIAVLANVLLVSAYLLALLNDQRQVERAKMKPAHKSMIVEIVIPTIEKITSNKKQIHNSNVAWFDGNLTPNNLDRLAIPPTASYTTEQRLKTEYEDIYEHLKKHDEHLRMMSYSADRVRERLQLPLQQYIDSNIENPQETSNIENPLEIPRASELTRLILNDVGYNSVNPPSLKVDYIDDWKHHRQDLRQIRDEFAAEEYSEFRDMRDEYLNHINDLEKELDMLHDELRKQTALP